jgi:hypothetical protein
VCISWTNKEFDIISARCNHEDWLYIFGLIYCSCSCVCCWSYCAEWKCNSELTFCLTVTSHRPNEVWESQGGQLLLLHWIMLCFVLFIYHQCVCGGCLCIRTVWDDQWRSGEYFRCGPYVHIETKYTLWN